MSSNFTQFSKPFLDCLKDTFLKMVQTEIKTHSPSIKKNSIARGDISAMIGMSGTLTKDDQIERNFTGLLILSWPEDVYIKMASRMLMEDYAEFCDEISDTGAEIANIIMGNAKNGLTPHGFKLGMATPTTIRGQNHMIKYPSKTTVIEMTVSSDLGDFTMELCYQEI